MESSMLEWALAYIARGWAVFPVHGIVDGRCTCRHGVACSRPGKHPRNSNGRTGATLDAALVRRWWKTWPSANIGIATGNESGLLVLDQDDQYALDAVEIPHTIESVTGRGGRHVLFSYPEDGARYITGTNIVAQGVDSRADGGYIVAPPSMHISGRRYQWEDSSLPDETDLASAPQWWLDAIRRADGDGACAVPSWVPDGELPENIQDMLEAIPADDYMAWRDVGLALNYTDPVNGLAWWDWWSRRSKKYGEIEVKQQWRAMTRKGHAVARPLTIDSIRQLAEKHGYTDPGLEHGAEVAAVFLASEQQRIAEQLAVAPAARAIVPLPDLLPRSGLIADIVAYILSSSIRPQPELAVAAATAYVGALAGRKYRTETDLRTNLYLVGIAESGAGKDHARKCVQKIAHASDTTSFLGGERIASGPGLITALRRNPSQLFMLDEFGFLLSAMTSARADAHKRDLMATLMGLYTSASVVYRGTEYADQEKRERVELVQPNACIYGTSTPAQFYAALTSMQGVDGSLARLLVVHASETRPARQRPSIDKPPGALVDAVRSLAARNAPPSGNLVGLGGTTVDTTDPQIVKMDPAIYDAWELLDEAMLDQAHDSATKTIYSRIAENAARLALVYAVSRDIDQPRIDAEAFSWGRELAIWAANSLVVQVARFVSDNEVESNHKRVASMVREAGDDGIGKNTLTRRCTFLRRKELDDVLAMLIQASLIVEVKGAVGPKGGRPTTVYKTLDPQIGSR